MLFQMPGCHGSSTLAETTRRAKMIVLASERECKCRGRLPATSGHALRLLHPGSVPALAPSPLEIGLNVGKGLRTMQPDVSETVDPAPPPPPPSLPEDGNAGDENTWDISVDDEDPMVQTTSANASSTASRPRRKSQVTHDVQNLLQDAMQPLSFRANLIQLVKRYIDYVAGVMVLLNSLVLIAELEVEGRSIAFEIDLPAGEDLRAYLPALRGIDAVFVLLFLVELVFRLLFERLKFCLDRSWAWAGPCASCKPTWLVGL